MVTALNDVSSVKNGETKQDRLLPLRRARILIKSGNRDQCVVDDHVGSPQKSIERRKNPSNLPTVSAGL